MLTFVAGIAVTVKFAFLSRIISVSVEPNELAVNWRGGWRSALTVYCGEAASHCVSECDTENQTEKLSQREKNTEAERGGEGRRESKME